MFDDRLVDFIQYLRFEKRYSPHTLTAYQKDLEQFRDYLIEESGQSVANLGYIVLSRSLFECTLAVPRSSRAEVVHFIYRIVEELRRI